MKILVTGGCGFIGSHLCQRLIAENHEVVCLDNLMTGSLQNLKHIINHPKFKFVNANIRNPIEIDFQPDQIYSLACPASPVHYQSASLQTLLTCLQGSINVLNLAQRHNSRVLLSSTSQVYGDPQVNPQPETYWGHVNPIGLRSCYDQGKRTSQTLFVEYNRVKGVDIRIARIFNTYGPRLDELDGRVVSNFVCEALRWKPITVYGDGSQTRSFCYIEDQIEGLVRLMNSEQYVGPINIGNPHEISIKELSEVIIKLCNSKSEIIYLSLPSDDPKKRNPDISKAKKYLNWQPKVSLEEGLTKTISYFKQLLSSRHQQAQNLSKKQQHQSSKQSIDTEEETKEIRGAFEAVQMQ